MVISLINPSNKQDVFNLVKAVIDAGCKWIILADKALKDALDLNDIVDFCRENEIILTFEDNPTMAKEYGVHGVYLSSKFKGSVPSIRETLGPEAIIGAYASAYETICLFERSDIDFVALDRAVDNTAKIVSLTRKENLKIPIVEYFVNSPESLKILKGEGVSGIIAEFDNSTNANRLDELKLLIETTKELLD